MYNKFTVESGKNTAVDHVLRFLGHLHRPDHSTYALYEPFKESRRPTGKNYWRRLTVSNHKEVRLQQSFEFVQFSVSTTQGSQ